MKTPPLERIREWDRELARLARNAGALRLGLGMGLEALARRGGHREMGFSSLEAYALERCGRSARWVQESRKLALTVEQYPRIRDALLTGKISWSMGALIAKHVSDADELHWAEEAERRTFREMKRLIFGPRGPFTEECEVPVRAGRSGAVASPTGYQARLDTRDGQARLDKRDGALPLGSSEVTEPWRGPDPLREDDEETVRRTLCVTAEREEIWLYECARMLVQQVSGHTVTMDDVVSALVAEGFTALLAQASAETRSRHWEQEESSERQRLDQEAAQRIWEAQLEQWRDRAEAERESRFIADCTGPEPSEVRAEIWRFDGAIDQIDAEIRKIADDLTTRDVKIGRLAEVFWEADGWRVLNYASGKQYARERLGMSLSSIKEKRQLARRLERMPALESALEKRTLGFEAARVVARIATPETVSDWVERAEECTVRHLREEADIADVFARIHDEPALPPDDDLIRRMQAIEGDIVSGAAFADMRSADGVPADSAGVPSGGESAGDAVNVRGRDASEESARGNVTPDAAADANEETVPNAGSGSGTHRWPCGSAGQTSAPPGLADIEGALMSLLGRCDAHRRKAAEHRPRSKRITLRLSVREETYRDYRSLERLFMRLGHQRERLFPFLCLHFVTTWKQVFNRDLAYGSVYRRDGYRCKSPVCGRRDVTPHHLKFRSAGGDDADENVASLCSMCHLEGIHGGRLRARPPASNIIWEIGRVPHTRIRGRRKVRSAP